MAKKRGRKSKSKPKSNITSNSKKSSSSFESNLLRSHQSDDIIIHLRIDQNLINNTPTYSPNISLPIRRDTESISQYEWIASSSQHKSDFYNDSLKPLEPFATYPFNKNQQIESEHTHTQRQNEMNNESKSFLETNLMQNTKNIIKCFWCCHTFSSEVCYLPLYKQNKEYFVYGTFCSPQCAAAYNFNDIILLKNPQDRYSLLHSLYFDRFHGEKIKLAPSRLSLSMFGGNLSIEEFREISCNKERDYKISISPIRIVKLHHSICNSNTNKETYNLQRKQKDFSHLF